MINLNKLIIIFPLIIIGCKTKPLKEINHLQTIDELNMNIYSKSGDIVSSIYSPNSSYNLKDNTLNLEETTINLFKDKIKKYTINSETSNLSNNNKTLELSGNVELRTIQKDNEIIIANKFIWNINDENYILEGDVKFENNNIILSSNKAILNNTDEIEFLNPVNYLIKDDNNKKSYEINSENALYNLITKSVSFKSENQRVRSKIYF